ncbi:HAD family hydrolase [Halobacteriales archaeon SW_7_68_16]|nr:MAG: HAD family hydrolase [Halobacteriales archaeon SW_7_68_16]
MTPSPQYDFWLFDLDGTLVDAEPEYVDEVFDGLADRMDRRFSDRERAVLWHGLTGSRDRQLRAWGIDPDAFWTAFHEIEDARARAEATYLHDDARLVTEIDAPVGIVTHCQRYLTDPVLDRLGIRGWFDTVLCCRPETGWKPDPEPVRRAMADLGIDPDDDGVLVGDGANDVGAAWNAGLDAVHVERHDPSRRGQCVLGDHRVSTMTALEAQSASD